MRTMMILALCGLALSGCKKKEPEPAPAKAAEKAEPMDPSKTVLVQVRGDHAFKNVVANCKTTPGELPKGAITGGEATITGLSGDCTLVFKPGDVTFGPVSGGQSWNCLATADGVSCKQN